MNMKKILLTVCTIIFYLFISCSIASASTLKIASSTKEIKDEAFCGDTSLEEVILPEGIRCIGQKAFAGSSLKKINLPSSLIEIASDALPSPAQVTILVVPGTYAYQWAVNNHYIVPQDVINDSMFTNVYVDSISETNATIHTKVSLPHNPTVAGYYFGTSENTLELGAEEDSSGMPLNNQIIWYDLKKWGKTLKPGTTYYYQFYIKYDGITYRTNVRSFKTAGTAGVLIDDSMFTTIYVDSITDINAVIHTKVSLPHNPTKAGYYFGTSANNLMLSATEDASKMPLNNQIIWYDLNKWGKTLIPGTTYYYRFYIVYDEVTYMTSIHSFSTNGNVSITCPYDNIELRVGETIYVPLTVVPSNAEIEWSSDISPIVLDQIVDFENGNITGLRDGITTITIKATANGHEASISIRVKVNAEVIRVLTIGNYACEDQADDFWLRFATDFCNFSEWLSSWYRTPNYKDYYMHGARNDAKGVLAAFSYSDYFDTYMYGTMVDENKNTIFSKICRSFADADDNDISILYLGGHGSTSTHNFCLFNREQISPAELKSILDTIKGRKVVMIGSCYSGQFVFDMKGKDYFIFSACTAEENAAPWKGNADYTGFGYYISYGLGYNEQKKTVLNSLPADSNNDNKVTMNELYTYVYNKIYTDWEGEQRPQASWSSSDGNMVIISR